MKTVLDEFRKQLVREALKGYCYVETDVEVPAEPHRISLWITPRETPEPTPEEQESLMNTQDIVDAWRQEAIEEGLEQGVKQGLEQGVKQGLEQGERRLLLRQLRRRFVAEVDGEIERRVAAASADQIEVWAERVLSAATLAEILAD